MCLKDCYLFEITVLEYSENQEKMLSTFSKALWNFIESSKIKVFYIETKAVTPTNVSF